MNMKQKIVEGVCVSAAMLMMLGAGSCNNENHLDVQYEKYKFETIAEVNADSVPNADDNTRYWQCEASGLLPVKIGEYNITALRDTLMSMASVRYADGKIGPKLPSMFKQETLAMSDSIDARSEASNVLSIVLMSPEVMVWRSSNYTYPAGAAHGMYSHKYLNYCLADGKVITLSDLFVPGSEELLTSMIRDVLATRDDLMEDVSDVNLSDNFRVTTDGVVFIYPLYSIAPYSSGEIEVPLDAMSLSPILTEHAARHLFDIED